MILKSIVTKDAVPFYDTELDIKPAFVCGGVQYYEVEGLFNAPYKRGMAAADIYEEVQMRVTREYLQLHCDAIQKYLSNPKEINVYEISKLTGELSDRVKWIVSPETLYKLASVVYFDKTEDPHTYSYEKAIKKIKHWKAHGVRDFFLQKPIKKFIPHSELPEEDLLNYIQTALKLERIQSESLLQELSKAKSTEDYYKITKSLLEAQS